MQVVLIPYSFEEIFTIFYDDYYPVFNKIYEIKGEFYHLE